VKHRLADDQQRNESTSNNTSSDQRERVHRDLDRFIGSWSAEEAEEFLTWLEEHRQIDSESWV